MVILRFFSLPLQSIHVIFNKTTIVLWNINLLLIFVVGLPPLV